LDSFLRDLDRERGKMQTDFENLERHYQRLHEYVGRYVRQTTQEWARLVVSHPASTLLIVETTRVVDEQGYQQGYSSENEPIRLSTLALASGQTWDVLLSPTHSKAVTGADYHGLQQADLIGKPRFADAWTDIEAALADRQLIIYGADWSRQAWRTVSGSDLLANAFCLHNKCREYYDEFYDLSLVKVLSYQGLEVQREELRDSRDRLPLLDMVVRNLAAGMPKKVQEPEPELADGELGDHPF
jgi:hypothetical protein